MKRDHKILVIIGAILLYLYLKKDKKKTNKPDMSIEVTETTFPGRETEFPVPEDPTFEDVERIGEKVERIGSRVKSQFNK